MTMRREENLFNLTIASLQRVCNEFSILLEIPDNVRTNIESKLAKKVTFSHLREDIRNLVDGKYSLFSKLNKTFHIQVQLQTVHAVPNKEEVIFILHINFAKLKEREHNLLLPAEFLKVAKCIVVDLSEPDAHSEASFSFRISTTDLNN